MAISIDDFHIDERIIPNIEEQVIEQYPVAICTPFYNSEAFIDRYLAYLTYIDWEQKLISLYFTVQGNDGTYDKLMKFKKSFGKYYRKIKIKKMPQSTGGELPHVRNVVFCRNNLIQWSKPDPVLFIDHDNFPPPYCLKRLSISAKQGGDIVGGVYTFYTRKDKDEYDDISPGTVGLTAFFIRDGKYYHSAINTGYEQRDIDPYRNETGNVVVYGNLSKKLMGKRLHVEATSMGTTLIQRKVLNDVKFVVPWGTEWTDDTAFCVEAGKKGYKCIADFGLFVDHWGFHVYKDFEDANAVYLRVHIDKEMATRRLKMMVDGVYVV